MLHLLPSWFIWDIFKNVFTKTQKFFPLKINSFSCQEQKKLVLHSQEHKTCFFFPTKTQKICFPPKHKNHFLAKTKLIFPPKRKKSFSRQNKKFHFHVETKKNLCFSQKHNSFSQKKAKNRFSTKT